MKKTKIIFFNVLITLFAFCSMTSLVHAHMKNNSNTFNSLPFKDSITIIKGNGSRKMAVFADPNCVPSMSYQKSLESLNNVKISIFVVPLKGDKSIALSKGIVCSVSPGSTWRSWMVNNILPSTGMCNANHLVSNYEKIQDLGISGTPTTIFSDGSILEGAAPASEIEKRLQMVYGAPMPLPSSKSSVDSNSSVNAPIGGNSMFK